MSGGSGAAPVLVVTDAGRLPSDLDGPLRDRATVCVRPRAIGPTVAESFGSAIVDVDLSALKKQPAALANLVRLKVLPNLYLVPAEQAPLVERSSALGVGDLLLRPFTEAEIARRVERLAARAATAPSPAASAPNPDGTRGAAAARTDAASEATAVLAEAFRHIQAGQAPRVAPFQDASRSFVEALAEAAKSAASLREWLGAIQSHHSATFRHSLGVTANAVLFGVHLGMRQADLERLSVAGLLHDIGKAVIPLGILDKPARLDPAEFEQIRRHPEIGRDLLLRSPDPVASELLDAVVGHHEYLDGSGYPYGLKGDRISDLVRIMTISDVYTALVEDRAYKAGMPPAKALGILGEMAEGGKIDPILLHRFRLMIGATAVQAA